MPTKGQKSKKGASNNGGSVKKWPKDGAPNAPPRNTSKALPSAPPRPSDNNASAKNKENVDVRGKASAWKTEPPNAPLDNPPAKASLVKVRYVWVYPSQNCLAELPSHMILQLFIQGPVSKDCPAAFSDPLLMDLFDLVGQKCRVLIENEVPMPGSLVVHGSHVSDVRRAYREICELLQRAGRHGQQIVFWIQSSSSNSATARTSVAPPEPLIHVEMDLATEAGSTSAHLQVAEFRGLFAKLAGKIKTIPHRLHMKFELGTLLVGIADGDDADASQGKGGLKTFLESASAKGATIFDQR